MAANEAAKASERAKNGWSGALAAPHTEQVATLLRRDIMQESGGFAYAEGHIGYKDGSVLHVGILKIRPWEGEVRKIVEHVDGL